jgi:hypothetical protein
LLDLYRAGSRLSLRKAGILISHLPPESATATALRLAGEKSGGIGREVSDHDPADDPWAKEDLLLASLIDEIRYLRYEYRSVNTKGKAGQPPKPVPRPGVKRSDRRKPLTMQQRMMLDPRMRGEG